MTGKKVLVTGGNGFIGQHVVQELRSQGYFPVVFDWHMVLGLKDGFFLGDITNSVAVNEAMAHVDGFIHLAGVLGTQETITNPRPAANVNIMGGLNVLDAAAGYDVPGVNIAVGNYWMNNTYSISKSTVERFVLMYRKERKARVSIVRAFNAYGPGQVPAHPFGPSRVRKIMPSFICRALAGQTIQVYGNGKQIMDMIHVRDVARILVQALEFTMETGGQDEPLEAGTGIRTTVTDIANEVLNNIPEAAGIEYLPMRPGEPRDSVVLGNPNTLAPLKDGKNFRLTTLKDGVAETVQWYRENVREYPVL